jgi:hypothetical protein
MNTMTAERKTILFQLIALAVAGFEMAVGNPTGATVWFAAGFVVWAIRS